VEWSGRNSTSQGVEVEEVVGLELEQEREVEKVKG
jgi:hypothetical protein